MIQVREHHTRRQPESPAEVRLYSPRAGVVVVRVSGVVDGPGADLLGERVRQQLARAEDVVIDVSQVPALDRSGTRMLADLDREAGLRGVHLHVAGVEDLAVREQLRRADITGAPCTDTIVALLPARVSRRPWGQRNPSPGGTSS